MADPRWQTWGVWLAVLGSVIGGSVWLGSLSGTVSTLKDTVNDISLWEIKKAKEDALDATTTAKEDALKTTTKAESEALAALRAAREKTLSAVDEAAAKTLQARTADPAFMAGLAQQVHSQTSPAFNTTIRPLEQQSKAQAASLQALQTAQADLKREISAIRASLEPPGAPPLEPRIAQLEVRINALAARIAEVESHSPKPAFSVFRDTLKDGSAGPAMVALPPGCFPMGSPETEADHRPDERLHEVCVQPFAIGRTEVTFAEYVAFAKATNRSLPAGTYDEKHPVFCTWNDAMAYTEWLSERTGQPYRLPTEAEWEYAARAATTTARFWGENADQACTWANVLDETGKRDLPDRGEEAHHCDDKFATGAPVGSFRANPWGLHDMLGNVWEMTASRYDKDYAGSESRAEPKESTSATALRGGSLASGRWLRAAYRMPFTPGAFSDTGFRVARTLTP